jgi:hypothetical protein
MIESKITGIPDLRAALAGIAPKLRVRALRNALAAGARLVQRAARARTPVMNPLAHGNRYAFRKGYRKPGTVRKAISVRTSKVSRRRGDVGVFVNVRPARGVKRGGKSPHDPFYWRWLNSGFLEAGAAQLSAAKDVFLRNIGPLIEKLNKPKAPAP